MNINITPETNLDEIKEMLKVAGDLENKIGKIKEQTVFISPKELAEILHCSLAVAREIFNREDFPKCDYGKPHVVFLPALWEYFMKPVKKPKEGSK